MALSDFINGGTTPATATINKNEVIGAEDNAVNVAFASIIANINADGGLAGWRDNIIPFGQAGKGAAAPAQVTDSNGFERFSFGVGDEVFTDFHVNHDYALGTVAYPHVHWMPTTTMTVGQTVVWQFSYVVAKGHQQGQTLLAAPTVITMTHTADGTELAGEHMITEVLIGSAFQLIEPDTVISARIRRITGTYPSAIYGLMADLHYQANYFSTKNRAPDFYV